MSIDYSIYEDLNDIPQKIKKDNIIIYEEVFLNLSLYTKKIV